MSQILVSSVWSDQDESGFTLGAEFYLGKLGTLCLPGLEQLKLSFNNNSMAKGILFCGEKSYLKLEDVEVTLHIAPEILRDAHGNGATISANCGLHFDDSTGFNFLPFKDASLNDARIAGTDIALTLNGIHFDPSSEDFLSVKSGSISLPMLSDSAGNPLVLQGQKISISLDGPSGVFERTPGAPLSLNLHGFACEIDDARVSLDHGQLVGVALGGRIDLGKFLAPGRDTGWVGIEFSIGPGGLVAALSRDEPIVDMKVDSLLDLAVDAIRLDGAGQGGDGTLWLSGNVTPRFRGVNGNWPTLAFDEIGIGPNGGLRLAKGATVATTQPFVLSWNFLKLTVTAFSLQRPLDAPDDLELRISAAVDIISGMPAGASVDGLVARWQEQRRRRRELQRHPAKVWDAWRLCICRKHILGRDPVRPVRHRSSRHSIDRHAPGRRRGGGSGKRDQHVLPGCRGGPRTGRHPDWDHGHVPIRGFGLFGLQSSIVPSAHRSTSVLRCIYGATGRQFCRPPQMDNICRVERPWSRRGDRYGGRRLAIFRARRAHGHVPGSCDLVDRHG
ncbi:hypothetical protein [Pseudomonas abieticivorans]|uniref:hypothetical protein n=1 Tax=Pseudomonas abieticivorans TaxID=2931382 RepID=UPI0020BF84C0|nr:hypothetical protein [Pseudomonas sp. PIA16]